MTLQGEVRVPSTASRCRLGEYGNTSVGLRYLVNFAQETEPVPPLGKTPLQSAACCDQLAVARALLREGADPDAKDKV